MSTNSNEIPRFSSQGSFSPDTPVERALINIELSSQALINDSNISSQPDGVLIKLNQMSSSMRLNPVERTAGNVQEIQELSSQLAPGTKGSFVDNIQRHAKSLNKTSTPSLSQNSNAFFSHSNNKQETDDLQEKPQPNI